MPWTFSCQLPRAVSTSTGISRSASRQRRRIVRPTLDGLTILRRWREAERLMPVLVLTARGSWHEKVQGMDAGADDYVSKPFRMEELLARLRALIRRSSGQVKPELACGAIRLDPRGRASRWRARP